MSNNRDDFSSKTQTRIKYCAGFRCCWPGCNKLLIGKANNKKGYVFNGVCSHITAASPGGPRYDASMTADERKSYENGILLCQDHASLIDKDDPSYPVDMLKQWKAKAEEAIHKELTSGKYYEKTTDEIEALLYALYENGELSDLRKTIDEYKASYGDEKDEILLRYKILLYLLIGGPLLETVNHYLKNRCCSLEWLVYELAIFHRKDILEPISNNITGDNNKKLVEFILLSTIPELASNGEFMSLLKLKDGATNHFIIQSLFYSEMGCVAKDKNGSDIVFKDEEFIYEMMIKTLLLKKRTILPNNNDEVAVKEAYIWLIKNLKTIDCLCTELRLPCLIAILRYLVFCDDSYYQVIYDSLAEEEKAMEEIVRINYEYQLKHEFERIDHEKLLNFCRANNDFPLFCFWLSGLTPDKALEYLNDHLFLLKESSLILLKYFMAINEKDRKELVLKYKDVYPKDDFNMSCLFWRYDIDGEKNKNNCFLLEKDHTKGLNIFNAMVYLDTIIGKGLYDKFFELADYLTHADADIALSAFKLQSVMGDDQKYDGKLIAIYEKLINNGFEMESLHHNLSMLYYRNSKTDLANKHLLLEYNQYHNVIALSNIIVSRVEQNEWTKDNIFDDAKNTANYNCQTYVAESYYQTGDYEQSLKHYERIALCANNRSCLPLKIMGMINSLKINNPDQVEDSTAVTIENSKETITLCFHSNDVMSIFDKTFEYDGSLDEDRFSDFYFKRKNDTVCFNGDKYTIINIVSIYHHYSHLALQQAVNNGDAIAFGGGTVEEAKAEITKFLSERIEDVKESLSDYKETKGVLPLSITCGRFFGGDLFENLSFIYRNKGMANINYSFGEVCTNHQKIYFYYDSIYALYLLYCENPFEIGENWYISKRIYNNIIAQCNRELRDIQDDAEKLTIKNSEPLRLKHNSEARNYGRNWYMKFEKFLSQFQVVEGGLFDLGKQIEVFREYDKTIASEREMIDLIQRNKDVCVVSDLSFIQLLMQLFNKDCCGTLSFVKESMDDNCVLSLEKVFKIE